MNTEEKRQEEKKWIAIVLALAMPGMGQIYRGDLVKGISAFVIFLAVFIAGFRWTVLLPDRLLIIGALLTITATLSVYVAGIIDAYRQAGKAEQARETKSYQRWYFLLAIWLFGSVLVSGGAYEYVRTDVLEAFKIVTRCMEPAVLRGDRIFADKTAYRRMPPKRGDIILLVHPDDRSKILVRTLEGLPGDTVTRPDGRTEQVPHGMIYVLGAKEESFDSRTFGFVPLKDVIGKARQIYYSSGDSGGRWSRIGTVPGKSTP